MSLGYPSSASSAEEAVAPPFVETTAVVVAPVVAPPADDPLNEPAAVDAAAAVAAADTCEASASADIFPSSVSASVSVSVRRLFAVGCNEQRQHSAGVAPRPTPYLNKAAKIGKGSCVDPNDPAVACSCCSSRGTRDGMC